MWLHERGYILCIFLSSFITYHQVCNKSNTISATYGRGPALFWSTWVHPRSLVVFVLLDLLLSLLFFFSFFFIGICPFVPFLLSIVLFVLRLASSDYFFGIFKLFFIEKRVDIFNVFAINLITLSKRSTQILTKATSDIAKL